MEELRRSHPTATEVLLESVKVLRGGGRADSKFSKESIAVVAAPSPVTL